MSAPNLLYVEVIPNHASNDPDFAFAAYVFDERGSMVSSGFSSTPELAEKVALINMPEESEE
jgi:hypothetical protein